MRAGAFVFQAAARGAGAGVPTECAALEPATRTDGHASPRAAALAADAWLTEPE